MKKAGPHVKLICAFSFPADGPDVRCRPQKEPANPDQADGAAFLRIDIDAATAFYKEPSSLPT